MIVMSRLNHTGTDQLRKGRASIPFARYFVTICTESRKPGLHFDPIRSALVEVLRDLHDADDLSLHCATVMPDHIHVLFTLGCSLSLSQTQGKFKSLTNSTLKGSELRWQQNYFDHRVRQDASLEPFARYIFLNPYRKQLIAMRESWAGWILNKHYQPEFIEHLQAGKFPPAEWLAHEEPIEGIINQDLAE